MQNKRSYLEHEMKYLFKALAKEPKKVSTLEFGQSAGARVQVRAQVQIRHR